MGIDVDKCRRIKELVIDKSIVGGVSTGPMLSNVAVGSSVPTLLPDKSDTDTGVGHSTVADVLTFVSGGVASMSITENLSKCLMSFGGCSSVGLTADISSVQGGGVIVANFNVYSVVANAGDCATLPSAFYTGMIIYIKNNGSNSMDVFPASGDDAGAGANTAVAVANGNFAVFLAISDNATWTKIMGGTA